jgi:hypothetical protein
MWQYLTWGPIFLDPTLSLPFEVNLSQSACYPFIEQVVNPSRNDDDGENLALLDAERQLTCSGVVSKVDVEAMTALNGFLGKGDYRRVMLIDQTGICKDAIAKAKVLRENTYNSVDEAFKHRTKTYQDAKQARMAAPFRWRTLLVDGTRAESSIFE